MGNNKKRLPQSPNNRVQNLPTSSPKSKMPFPYRAVLKWVLFALVLGLVVISFYKLGQSQKGQNMKNKLLDLFSWISGLIKAKKCDYSDIINDQNKKDLFQQIRSNKTEYVSKTVENYTNTLKGRSDTPYVDEPVWIQNFNNMQKIFSNEFWTSIKQIMLKIIEKLSLQFQIQEWIKEQKKLDEDNKSFLDSCKNNKLKIGSTKMNTALSIWSSKKNLTKGKLKI